VARKIAVWYTKLMTAKEAPLHTKLIVRSFHKDDIRELSDIESRLMHLGFMDGESIKITRKAPFSRGPLLIEVRGRSVALTLDEASLISVEVSG
jgi:Fe2+ transport system protein FeoA